MICFLVRDCDILGVPEEKGYPLSTKGYCFLARDCNMVISKFPKIGGPQYRPQNTTVRIMGTPKKQPLIFWETPIYHTSRNYMGVSRQSSSATMAEGS